MWYYDLAGFAGLLNWTSEVMWSSEGEINTLGITTSGSRSETLQKNVATNVVLAFVKQVC